MDHRLAIIILAGLVMGAGAPLAMAWVRVLPEDAAPFANSEEAKRNAQEGLGEGEKRGKRSDPWTVGLLVLVTISYALQFPGVPREAFLHWFGGHFEETTEHWIRISAVVFFAFVPGLTACYSLLRRNFVRIPLIAASLLVLLLWLLGPFLQTALVAS